MSVLLFLLILVSLIVVHELGHFAAAKFFGIRVDEFGIGFPPRLFGRKWGETMYTVNLLPFGGFVKIFGEDGEAVALAPEDAKRSFIEKSRPIQAAVLVAGVFMNIITAWLILSVGFMVGLPESSADSQYGALKNIQPTVVQISPNSPASDKGIETGDHVQQIAALPSETISGDSGSDKLREFIAAHADEDLTVTLERGGVVRTVIAKPSSGISGAPEGKKVLGIDLVDVGTLRLPIHKALFAGAVLTKDLTVATAVGLYDFAKTIVVGKADFSTVSGPVGIVGVVGQASQLGLAAVLTLAAVIAVNLAIINLIPFPALDGGRLLIVLIEAVRRKPIPQKLSLWVNAGGFAVLIVLMIVVTYHDIAKLFI